MMARLFLCITSSSLLFACSPSTGPSGPNTTRITPLTSGETAAVRSAIETGSLTPAAALAGLPTAESTTPELECLKFTDALAKDVTRGFVTVPEDWSNPSGAKIKVFYYFKPTDGTPIVFFNGGPSHDSHGSSQILGESALAKSLPMVYVDQRGTGCSTAYPTAHPERLGFYTTRSIVKDAEAIRRQIFGERKWKVFGQSYGGLIAHRYAEIAPDGAAGFFAHGYAITSDPIEFITARMIAQIRIWKEYSAAFPGDDQIFREARRNLKETTCFTDGEKKMCGPATLDSLSTLLGFQTSWPTLHQWIQGLRPGGASVPQAKVVEMVARYFVFGAMMTASVPSDVISRSEITPGLTDQQVCEKVLPRMRARGIDPAQSAINECRLLVRIQELNPNSSADANLPLKADPVSLAHIKQNLLSHPDRPLFVYSGGKDGFVPVEIFSEEAKVLDGIITYRNFPASGHEGFYTEPQVFADLLSVP